MRDRVRLMRKYPPHPDNILINGGLVVLWCLFVALTGIDLWVFLPAIVLGTIAFLWMWDLTARFDDVFNRKDENTLEDWS